ncbi:hypothetical protein [uncultured Nostoc sp.]|uniref:hypothetical protein n=1 Tax=uncultured Nostoc sp. TaxID=340711 RepID=UPI0035CC5321
MQSLSPALYPATDSEYQIQWGTYGVIVKMMMRVLYKASNFFVAMSTTGYAYTKRSLPLPKFFLSLQIDSS